VNRKFATYGSSQVSNSVPSGILLSSTTLRMIASQWRRFSRDRACLYTSPPPITKTLRTLGCEHRSCSAVPSDEAPTTSPAPAALRQVGNAWYKKKNDNEQYFKKTAFASGVSQWS
jgi:hypothetical protein